jgi:beta-aspartyl-dipeptidase (metallo-type)
MNNMLKLLKNCEVYTPQKLGKKEILVAGEKIIKIDDSINLSGIEYQAFDFDGKIVVPGFIDQHVHITGGGGQTGYASMVPEVQMSELIACGTTTVLGMLGTDGFVKELTTLYAKCKALDMDGITAFMLTSYYGLPEKTILSSVANDIIFLDKVIGCKLAISDDRCSFPSETEILRLINQVRLGGFTSNKTGILHLHVGALASGIEVLLDIARKYPTLIQHISPTHVIRTRPLFDQAIAFAKLGGMIDISTGGTQFDNPYQCVLKAIQEGVSVDSMTFSSDGRGGVRRIDPKTGEDSYKPAPLHRNFSEMVKLVKEGGLPLEQALCLITSSPAKNLKIPNKGHIREGYDADFCVLDQELNLTEVFAKGTVMMTDSKVVRKGKYEI